MPRSVLWAERVATELYLLVPSVKAWPSRESGRQPRAWYTRAGAASPKVASGRVGLVVEIQSQLAYVEVANDNG
jgi:hypothetical protein